MDVRVLDLLFGGGHQQVSTAAEASLSSLARLGNHGTARRHRTVHLLDRTGEQVFDQVTGIDLGDLVHGDVVTVEFQRLRADRQTTEPVEN